MGQLAWQKKKSSSKAHYVSLCEISLCENVIMLEREAVVMKKIVIIMMMTVLMCTACADDDLESESVPATRPVQEMQKVIMGKEVTEVWTETMTTAPRKAEDEADTVFSSMSDDEIEKILYEDLEILIENHNFYTKLYMGNMHEVKEQVYTGRFKWYYRLHIDGIESLLELETFCRSIYAGEALETYLKWPFFEQDGYLCMYDVVGSSSNICYDTMFDVEPDADGFWASFLDSSQNNGFGYGFYGGVKKVYFVIEDGQVKIAKINFL